MASLLALAVAGLARAGYAQEVRGSGAGAIVGTVTVQGSTFGLPYAVVSIPALGLEQFTNGGGQFTVDDLPAVRIALRIKRIGYLPLDTTIDVRAGDTTRVEIAMAHVPAQLPPVRTTATACNYPGRLTTSTDARLGVLLEQVRENAERHRLLTRTYPFQYDVERTLSRWDPDSAARISETDTLQRDSRRAWRYAPGRLMALEVKPPGPFGGRWVTMVLPDLADFADDEFARHHCFDYAGIELVAGDSLLRIDFAPVPTVRTPDVSGSLYLDRTTFRLRRTVIRLVNLTRDLKTQISAHVVETSFAEILADVAIADRVSSTVSPSERVRVIIPEPTRELQRVIGVRFVNGRP